MEVTFSGDRMVSCHDGEMSLCDAPSLQPKTSEQLFAWEDELKLKDDQLREKVSDLNACIQYSYVV